MIKQKINIIFLGVIITILLLSACGSRKGETTMVNKDELNLNDVKVEVSYDLLLETLQKYSTLNEINNTIPMKNIKECNSIYRNAIKTDKGWFFILFDNNEAFIDLKRINISNLNSKKYAILTIGMPLNQVKQIDPSGDYTFCLASWSNYPQKSYHYSSDGYEIVISYNENYIIENVNINQFYF